GLAEAGRAEEEDVIERLAAIARRGDGDLEVGLDLVLADVLAEELGAEGELGLEIVCFWLRREDTVHRVSCSLPRAKRRDVRPVKWKRLRFARHGIRDGQRHRDR